MSIEDNKATVRRLIEEAWNQGRVALLDELCAPDFIFHEEGRPDVGTLEDYKRGITAFRSAIPDMHVTIEDMIVEGDKMAVRLAWGGTNTGDLVTPQMRLPATGKHVSMTMMGIGRFVEGKLVELWLQENDLSLFQQLGLIPMPGPVG